MAKKKATTQTAELKVTLQLVSTDSATHIQPFEIECDLNVGRPTQVIGEAVRRLCRLTQYKKPVINLLVNGEMFGAILGGQFSISSFTRINFGVLKMLMDVFFSTENQLTAARISNEAALSIARAMGFEGANISHAEYYNFVNEKARALRLLATFAKADATEKAYYASIPQPVLAWSEAKKEEAKQKRLLAAQAKAAS